MVILHDFRFFRYSSTYAHTARLRRALSGLRFYATSWRFPRSSQERNQGFPPWNPLSPAVLTMNGGGFAFAKFLHLGRIYRTPKMGLLLARVFAVPFLFEICASSGALQGAAFFAFVWCVTLPCWQFPVKLPTQSLNLLVFAKTLEALGADSFGAHLGGSQGERLGVFSFAISLRRGKEMAQNKPLARADIFGRG